MPGFASDGDRPGLAQPARHHDSDTVRHIRPNIPSVKVPGRSILRRVADPAAGWQPPRPGRRRGGRGRLRLGLFPGGSRAAWPPLAAVTRMTRSGGEDGERVGSSSGTVPIPHAPKRRHSRSGLLVANRAAASEAGAARRGSRGAAVAARHRRSQWSGGPHASIGGIFCSAPPALVGLEELAFSLSVWFRLPTASSVYGNEFF